MKKFFILMIVSCMLLVGCGSSSTTEKDTVELPECKICHQTKYTRDWQLVSVTVHGADTYWYKCIYCGNVIGVYEPIIRECFQK
jgi:major membrane immunogen (membrane-anchored lipoprotein)